VGWGLVKLKCRGSVPGESGYERVEMLVGNGVGAAGMAEVMRCNKWLAGME